jgi:hypothetical protein
VKLINESEVHNKRTKEITMFDLNDPNTFWLNVTNIALGLVTLICCAVVGYGVLQEVLVRYRHRKLVEADDHAFLATDLGLTMADGGERIEKSSLSVSAKGEVQEAKPKQKKQGKK